MNKIHSPSMDLNLLRVFDAMADELSVARTGARLGLTPSAVSHALRRLRQTLDDPLFVRAPDGMRPTARAQEIAPRLRQGLAQLQEALNPAAFSPSETTRRFTMAASGYVCAVLMPEVAALIRAEAPGADVRVRPIREDVGEDLMSGRIDLAIGGFGHAANRFERELLFTETAVWALRAGHPLAASERLTVETLGRIPQVLTAVAEDQAVDGRISEGGLERWVIWDDRGALDEALTASGQVRQIGLIVPDATSALSVVSRTDMIALVPRRLGCALARPFGLKLFDPPYPSRTGAVEALWRRDLGDSPAIDWLRGRLREASARL
jgi:DNA-binding transcriptional LysR family regulator